MHCLDVRIELKSDDGIELMVGCGLKIIRVGYGLQKVMLDLTWLFTLAIYSHLKVYNDLLLSC